MRPSRRVAVANPLSTSQTGCQCVGSHRESTPARRGVQHTVEFSSLGHVHGLRYYPRAVVRLISISGPNRCQPLCSIRSQHPVEDSNPTRLVLEACLCPKHPGRDGAALVRSPGLRVYSGRWPWTCPTWTGWASPKSPTSHRRAGAHRRTRSGGWRIGSRQGRYPHPTPVCQGVSANAW